MSVPAGRALLALASAGVSIAVAQPRFPEVRVQRAGLAATWKLAQSIVVGDVNDIRSVGSEQLPKAPAPLSPGVLVYWCEGNFRVDGVVSGRAPVNSRFLWATIRPGCGLEWMHSGYEGMVGEKVKDVAQPVTRIWLVREEGEYVRPALDMGNVLVSLHTRKDLLLKPGGQKTLGRLLLDPDVVGAGPPGYVAIFGYPYAVDLALDLLGEAETAKLLGRLAASKNRALHDAACSYLGNPLNRPCR